MSTLFTIRVTNLDFLCQDIGMKSLTRISMRIGLIRIRKETMVVSRPMARGFMASRNPQALRSQPMAFWCSQKRVYDNGRSLPRFRYRKGSGLAWACYRIDNAAL